MALPACGFYGHSFMDTNADIQAAEPGMAVREVVVVNKHGIHARPAASFVNTANNFRSDIKVKKGDLIVSGKSIMGLLMLEGHCGTRLQLLAEGPDAEEAVKALQDLMARKFYFQE